MKLEKILLPIDLVRCPLEALAVARAHAQRLEVGITLLHVVELSVDAVDNRLYREAGWAAEQSLARLAERYLPPLASLALRVRLGKPAEEIVAEAREATMDLIILATCRTALWRRLRRSVLPGVAERVLRQAPCPLLVLHAKALLNCEEQPDEPTAGGSPAAESPRSPPPRPYSGGRPDPALAGHRE